eukprot:gene15068-16623_t
MIVDEIANSSLQDAFAKFRKQRIEQMKLSNKMKAKLIEESVDTERVNSLRAKFLKQAMMYIGVPYAKRYHDKESPDYNAPLFLDCCGLVRRVLMDLKKDFGFKIGRWNQAYQFDTLPITIEKEEDMKPGDLVFISGTYFKPHRKKQKHDMVHVEIWMGDGEKTLGARNQRGRIQVHDSYKFVSKGYYNMVYYFKSIDTWLKGVCQSFCSEHTWKSAKYIDHGKHSIFAINDEDSESQSAGDDDHIYDDDEPDMTSEAISLASNLNENETREQVDVSEIIDSSSCECIGECSCSCSECGSVRSSQCDTAAQAVCRIAIKESDAEEHSGMMLMRVMTSLVMRIPTGLKAAHRVIKVKPRSQPDKENNSRHMVSSSVLPNANNDRRRSRSKSPPKPLSKPTASLASVSKGGHRASPKFYIGGHNGVALVEKPLLEMGWTRISDNKDLSYYLKWVECKSQIDYKSFKEGEQLVNHISNGGCLTSKHGLLQTLLEYERITNRKAVDNASKINLADFYPETYSIDSRQEIEIFSSIYKAGETWICKPSGANQGKGIFLVRSLDQMKKELLERAANRTRRSSGRIVSRYLTNPLLLNGCKFDIRAYMLIASTVPYMVFYHPGYVRLSCVEFSNDSTDITAHLTNQYIQKKHPEYSKGREASVWTMQRFNDYINSTYKDEKNIPEDWAKDELTLRMKEIMLLCFRAAHNKLQRRMGYFDLLGFDFMVDENMKVWLIEINVNPALFTNCASLQQVIPGVIDETLRITIEAFENKCSSRKRVNRLTSVKNFELLYDGERNVSFRRPKVSQPLSQTATSESGHSENVAKTRDGDKDELTEETNEEVQTKDKVK